MTCDASTYARRGWCRLEQWARIAGVKGEVPIYILGRGKEQGLETIDLQDEWCREAILVFEGDFTVASDKEALVTTVLGLWALALQHRDHSDRLKQLHALVQEMHDRVFPPQLFRKMPQYVTELSKEEQLTKAVRQSSLQVGVRALKQIEIEEAPTTNQARRPSAPSISFPRIEVEEPTTTRPRRGSAPTLSFQHIEVELEEMPDQVARTR